MSIPYTVLVQQHLVGYWVELTYLRSRATKIIPKRVLIGGQTGVPGRKDYPWCIRWVFLGRVHTWYHPKVIAALL